MSNREKIVKGLERCLICDTSVFALAEGKKAYRDCEYTIGSYCGKDKLLHDVLALLKEQEAVEPYQHDAVWLCGNCDKEVVGWDDDIDGKKYRYPFCRQCGRPVEWE